MMPSNPSFNTKDEGEEELDEQAEQEALDQFKQRLHDLPKRSAVRFAPNEMDIIKEDDQDSKGSSGSQDNSNNVTRSTVVDLSDLYYNDNDDKVEITKIDIPEVQVNGVRHRSSAAKNGSINTESLSPRQLHRESLKPETRINVDDDYIRRMTVRTIFRNSVADARFFNLDPSQAKVDNRLNRENKKRLKKLYKRREAPAPLLATKDEFFLSDKYESLDYEPIENDLYRDEETTTEYRSQLFRQSINQWVVCILAGIGTAITATLIDIGVNYASKLKFDVIIKSLLKHCGRDSHDVCKLYVLFAWILFNCTFVGIACCLVLFVSRVAAGSGIPQIKCYLNGIKIPDIVKLKTLIAKAAGVAFSVGGGLSAGKEGPMIHSGAVVAAGISQGKSNALGLDLGFFGYFRNDKERRDFVAAGAAAGVAAAFGAPVGGVLFALEEGASHVSQITTWRMALAAMFSTLTLKLGLSIWHGNPGKMSWNGLVDFGSFGSSEYDIWEIPIFIFIGIVGGLTGALFNFINVEIAKFRKAYVKERYQKFCEAVLVAMGSALTAFYTVLWSNDCKDVGNMNASEVSQLWCPEGQYSPVGSLFLESPGDGVKLLFHNPQETFEPLTVLIFSIEYFLLTMWTFGLAVPSGIFIPLLFTGAGWGRFIGIYVTKWFPKMAGRTPGKYALVGAASQLGGVVRMVVSLTIIIVEATVDMTFGLPLLIMLIVNKWVGDIFNEGLYDTYIELDEIPLLGWEAPRLARNILAPQIMRKDVVALRPNEDVGRILTILSMTRHHAFPVVDRIGPKMKETGFPDYGYLQGIVTRSQLITLLKNYNFTRDIEGRYRVPHYQSIDIRDFREKEEQVNFNLRIATLAMNVEKDSYWLDLMPHIHHAPHRVMLSSSLEQIYRIFRILGLRHLCVIDEQNKLRGIITRKDIARYREHRHGRHYQVHELYVDTVEKIVPVNG